MLQLNKPIQNHDLLQEFVHIPESAIGKFCPTFKVWGLITTDLELGWDFNC